MNTTDSAVRITHKPTGVVVAMQDEKSQIQNRARAMVVLRRRLLKLEQDRQAAELSDARRGQVGGGGRSEKIRTYNFKENRVTDHRIGLTLYKLDKVLAGELDEVIDALVADEQTRRLLGEEATGHVTGRAADATVSWRRAAGRDRGDASPRRASSRPDREAAWLVEEASGSRGRRPGPRPRTSRPPTGRSPRFDAMVARRLARRAAAVRARALGVPLARPAGRPPGADPAPRDRAGGRGRARRARSHHRPRPTARLVVADLGTGQRRDRARDRTRAARRIGSGQSSATPDASALAPVNVAALGQAVHRVQVVEGSWFDALPAARCEACST